LYILKLFYCFDRTGLTLSDRLMYLGRAMACLRSKKLSIPALNVTSLRDVEDLLQVAEIQKMVGSDELNIYLFIVFVNCFIHTFFELDIGFIVV